MSIRAVLFDLFDTLVYMQTTGARAEGIRLVAQAGICEQRWIAGWRSISERALSGEIETLEERVREGLAAAGLPAAPGSLVRSLVAVRRRDVLEAPCVYADVADSLRGLRERGFRLGLVSNIYPYETTIIDRFGLRQILEAVVLSCEMRVRKPDPRIYLAAAQRLSLEPRECVFVGDGMSRELSGARAAGMLAVRIDRSQRDDDQDRDEAYDARVETLPELLAWLEAREALGK